MVPVSAGTAPQVRLGAPKGPHESAGSDGNRYRDTHVRASVLPKGSDERIRRDRNRHEDINPQHRQQNDGLPAEHRPPERAPHRGTSCGKATMNP
jgi:hypothetical protein